METRSVKKVPVRTKDGVLIYRMVFEPKQSNGSVVIIGSSAAVNQEFYQTFASDLQQNGFGVVTFDYRGVGSSKPDSLKRYHATLSQWGLLDLDAIILSTKNQFPGYEIIFIGHQISGIIAGMAPSFQYIDRLVLVSSGLPSQQIWPLPQRVLIHSFHLLKPILQVIYGYFPGVFISALQNLPMEVVQEWVNICKGQRGIIGVIAEKNYNRFRGSILTYNFSNDQITSPKAVRALLQQFPKAHQINQVLQPKMIGQRKTNHLTFFEGKTNFFLWDDLIQWLNNRHII